MDSTALLVMDLQNAIVSRFADNADFLSKVQKTINKARQTNISIIHVVVKFRADYPEVSEQNKAFSFLKSGALNLLENEEPAQIHKAIAPQANDIIVTKRRVSAFSGSDLEIILRSKKINHIILSGIATSGVVLSTLREAADKDFQITVLSDCCLDTDVEVHRVLTEKIFPAQAEVITAEKWFQQK